MLYILSRRGKINDYISSSCLMFMIKGVSEECWEVYFGVIEREQKVKNVNGSLWGEMGLVWLGDVRGPKAR